MRTRFVGASANGVDWDHAANVLAAWHASLAYSDGDGDEAYLPSDAEWLVELWSHAVAKKKSAKAVAATEPARPYDPRACYRVGDAIAHARFGVGVVVSVTDTLAVIRFASGERKLAHTPREEAAAPTTDHVTALPRSTAVTHGVVRRLPPDPRLLEPDAQFADLASDDDDGKRSR